MKNASKLLIEYSKRFDKQRKAAPIEIKTAFREALALFIEDQNYPFLRNHALRGKYIGFRSIDVSEDWRAIYKKKQTKSKTTITFHLIGTHKKLYKKS